MAASTVMETLLESGQPGVPANNGAEAVEVHAQLCKRCNILEATLQIRADQVCP